jgi:hypothetical protein
MLEAFEAIEDAARILAGGNRLLVWRQISLPEFSRHGLAVA